MIFCGELRPIGSAPGNASVSKELPKPDMYSAASTSGSVLILSVTAAGEACRLTRGAVSISAITCPPGNAIRSTGGSLIALLLLF